MFGIAQTCAIPATLCQQGQLQVQQAALEFAGSLTPANSLDDRDCTNCAGWLIQPKHHVGLTLLPPPVSQPNHPDPCWARFSAAAAAAFFLFSRSTYMTQTQSEGRTQ